MGFSWLILSKDNAFFLSLRKNLANERKTGKYNQLEVVKEVDFGVYLDGGDDGEIFIAYALCNPKAVSLAMC